MTASVTCHWLPSPLVHAHGRSFRSLSIACFGDQADLVFDAEIVVRAHVPDGEPGEAILRVECATSERIDAFLDGRDPLVDGPLEVLGTRGVTLLFGEPFPLRGLHTLAGVPGRFEVVSGSDSITVIVDYAHTPDGIASAISAARSMKPRRVVVVVGAGGDRDRAKRPLMGSAASQADLTIITSDNPRSEDPGTIIDAVQADGWFGEEWGNAVENTVFQLSQF